MRECICVYTTLLFICTCKGMDLSPKAVNEDSRQLAYLLPLAYSIQKLLHFRIPDRVQSEVLNPHTSNLWGMCPLYGCNVTGRPISWEIH